MTATNPHLYVVILCGGGGTRLWPLSRSATPKQFIDLVGRETLFEKTLKRARLLVADPNIFIMTNKDYEGVVAKFANSIPPENIIAEPAKKNTAMAMGTIAGLINARDKEAVIINLASDHLIGDDEGFCQAVLAAAEIAGQNKFIVTVGITPSFPHTGLGYIHADGEVTRVNNLPVIKVAGFREKPDLASATEFLATGKYFWNANLYTWSSALIMAEFAEHAPHLFAHIEQIVKHVGKQDFEAVFANEYAQAKEEQIDTAISEKTTKLAVIPGNFGWSDIGSWNVVYDEVGKDDAGNAMIAREEGADWLAIDTKNSLVSSYKKQIVTLGLENIVVVDTPDALLVMHKDRSQEVKKIVENLKSNGKVNLL